MGGVGLSKVDAACVECVQSQHEHVLQHFTSHLMLSVEKYQSTSGHHGRFPCCFMAKPWRGGQGEGAGSAQKQEGCAYARVKVSEKERFILYVFQLFSLSKCFHQITKTPTTINHMWEMFYEINIHDWGVVFLRRINSFSIPLHSFSHWHCRNLVCFVSFITRLKCRYNMYIWY